MNKKELIRTAAQGAGVTQETAAKVLSALLEAAADALSHGDPVKVQGFGTLTANKRLSFIGSEALKQLTRTQDATTGADLTVDAPEDKPEEYTTDDIKTL